MKNKNNKQISAVIVGLFALTPIHVALAQQTNNSGGQQDSTNIGAVIKNTLPNVGPSRTDCAASAKSWVAGGYICNGMASNCPYPGAENCPVPADTDVRVDDYKGAGDALYHCNGGNGQLTVYAGSETCSAPPACPSALVTWSNCFGNAGSGTAQDQITVSNTKIGYSGSAGFACQLASPSATLPSWVADPSASPASCVSNTPPPPPPVPPSPPPSSPPPSSPPSPGSCVATKYCAFNGSTNPGKFCTWEGNLPATANGASNIEPYQSGDSGGSFNIKCNAGSYSVGSSLSCVNGAPLPPGWSYNSGTGYMTCP